MDWTEPLDILVTWTHTKGYIVEFVKQGDDAIYDDTKIIEINLSNNKEKQFYRLVHECGHILINDDNGIFGQKKSFNNLKKDTSAFKTARVIEEIEAWKRGFHLAKRLNLPIDECEWRSNMLKAIKKYIMWASEIE